jgi:hypothetical protein
MTPLPKFPWGDYKTLPCVLLSVSNVIFFKEIVHITGPLANAVCFLGRHSSAIYTLGCAPKRWNPMHLVVWGRGFNVPERNCFWNQLKFSFVEALCAVTFEIFRDFGFGIIISAFDLGTGYYKEFWRLYVKARKSSKGYNLL